MLALIAVGVALYLVSLDATTSTEAVRAVASDLREANVAGADYDPGTAHSMISAMELLLASPELLSDSVEDLKTFSSTAASWAVAAEPGPALHTSVLIRRAAGELRAYALKPADLHLARARRCLDAARSSADGDGGGSGGFGGGPGLGVGVIRDQIENLEQSQRERRQEIDEDLKD